MIELECFQVDVMTITHYGQPGNLQFQYPIQTPLRFVTFLKLAILTFWSVQ